MDMFARLARSINNKENGLCLMDVIIIILLCIALGFAVNTDAILNTIVNGVELQCDTQYESLLCNDYNPCTLDILSPVPCSLGSTCSPYQCTYLALANGSCCNHNDFCYYNDPLKTCVYGTCMSPDFTLCKGYCNTDADCFPITALNPVVNTTTTCVFHSCLTQFVVQTNVVSPLSLMNLTVANSSNISSCLSAICVNDFDAGFSTCTYQWTCAPFRNDAEPPGKRAEAFDDESYDSASVSPTSISNSSSSSSSDPRFPLRGIYRNAYRTVNQLILSRVRSFAASVTS